jgi:hypothetical protein
VNRFPEAKAFGGGKISFCFRNRTGWSAKISDRSVELGIFDPAILELGVRKAITQALNMKVSFEWVE